MGELIPKNEDGTAMSLEALNNLYQTSAGVTDADEMSDADVSLIDKFVTIRPSKDGTFTAELGKEKFDLPSGTSRIDVVIVSLRTRRALWPPSEQGSDEKKRPVCTSKYTAPGAKTCGVFNTDNDAGIGPSGHGEVLVSCDKCPYNEWETKSLVDPKYEGKAKACGEGRSYFLMPVRRVATMKQMYEKLGQKNVPEIYDDIGIYEENLAPYNVGENPGIVIAELSVATTMKVLRQIPKLHAANNKIPKAGLSTSVFRIKAKADGRGTIKWGTIEIEWIGMVSPGVLKSGKLKDLSKFVTETVDELNTVMDDKIAKAVQIEHMTTEEIYLSEEERVEAEQEVANSIPDESDQDIPF